MPPHPKHLCACNCALYVTRKVEIGHLNGQRSALLSTDVLLQNKSLIRSHKKASIFQTMSPSRRLGKQKIVGRCAPAQQALSSENLSSEPGEAFNFPMSEAGPSKAQHDSQFLASPQASTMSARQFDFPSEAGPSRAQHNSQFPASPQASTVSARCSVRRLG
jgi:hypothetical protein